jgi:hypothetical protein
VGRLSWTIPSWVPIVGGNTISAPKLPKFHSGGFIDGPGPVGSEVVIKALVGERVVPIGGDGGGGTTNVYHITVNGLAELQEFLDWQANLRNDGRGGGEVVE